MRKSDGFEQGDRARDSKIEHWRGVKKIIHLTPHHRLLNHPLHRSRKNTEEMMSGCSLLPN